MPKIKYMGTADVAILEKGEDFGGRLSEEAALGKRIEFNEANNWIVDTDEAEVSAEFVALLLENDSDRFKDVSGAKRIPDSDHQKIFRGAKGGTKADEIEEVAPGGSEVSDGDTTVGGSTGGDGGTARPSGGRRGGTAGGGTSVGGSTAGD